MGNYQSLSADAQKKLNADISNIFEQTGFHKTAIQSKGPRYYLATGTYQRSKAIFKINVRSAAYDRMTNEKLAREALFLDFLKRQQARLSKAVPVVHAFETQPHAWYIREYISGTPQHAAGNEVQFRKSFLNDESRTWLTQTLRQLHRLTARDVPHSFATLLYPPELPGYMWKFIEPYQKQIDDYTKSPGLARSLRPRFTRANALYRSAPRVLAHQELYPGHIIRAHRGLTLIDWENIGWGLPTYDYVTVWLRAFDNPEWQEKLYQAYRRHYRDYRDAERLWHATVFIQSVFNIVGYHFYPGKKKFRPLADFCSAIVLNQHAQAPARYQ